MSMAPRFNAQKMVITLLCDIISVCERSKYMTVGYSGLNEKVARLQEIHKAFYKYAPLNENNCSTVIVQLDIIENLFNGKKIRDSIAKAFENVADAQPIENLLSDGFININSLKQANDTGLRKKCFSREELEKVLR